MPSWGPDGFGIPRSSYYVGNLNLATATAAQFTAVNPVLPEAYIGFETDTLRFKLSDGVSDWNSLPYWRLDTPDDVIIDNPLSGIVLKSPDGHYWRVLVDNAGALSQTDLGITKPT